MNIQVQKNVNGNSLVTFLMEFLPLVVIHSIHKKPNHAGMVTSLELEITIEAMELSVEQLDLILKLKVTI